MSSGAEQAQLMRALASARARHSWHEAETLEDRLFEARRGERRFKHFKPSNRPRAVHDDQAAMLAVVSHRRECHDNATHKGCDWGGVTFTEVDHEGVTLQRRMGGPCTPGKCRHCKDDAGTPWQSRKEAWRLDSVATRALKEGGFTRPVLSAYERAELRNVLLTLGAALRAIASRI